MRYFEVMPVPKNHPLDILREAIEVLRESADFDQNIDPKQLKRFLPIADSAGPICIDTSIDESLVDFADPSTWSICWFDHEEFDFLRAGYMDKDGNVTGRIMYPTFKSFMEIHFKGIFNDLVEHWSEEEE